MLVFHNHLTYSIPENLTIVSVGPYKLTPDPSVLSSAVQRVSVTRSFVSSAGQTVLTPCPLMHRLSPLTSFRKQPNHAKHFLKRVVSIKGY